MKGARISNPKDFGAGLLFVFFGGGFVVIARGYQFGSAMHMGPGYFPTVLGALLVLIGLATAARGLVREGEPIGKPALRLLALITLATVLFGVLVPRTGMIVAGTVNALVGAMASSYFRLRWAVPLALGLAISAALIFVAGLGLPLPVFQNPF